MELIGIKKKICLAEKGIQKYLTLTLHAFKLFFKELHIRNNLQKCGGKPPLNLFLKFYKNIYLYWPNSY